MEKRQEKLTLHVPRPRLAALCAHQMSSVRLLVAEPRGSQRYQTHVSETILLGLQRYGNLIFGRAEDTVEAGCWRGNELSVSTHLCSGSYGTHRADQHLFIKGLHYTLQPLQPKSTMIFRNELALLHNQLLSYAVQCISVRCRSHDTASLTLEDFRLPILGLAGQL